MKMTRHSERQILSNLRQTEGVVLQMASQIWGMDSSMTAQTKAPEDKSLQLKKMFAEFRMQNELSKEALGKKVVGPSVASKAN